MQSKLQCLLQRMNLNSNAVRYLIGAGVFIFYLLVIGGNELSAQMSDNNFNTSGRNGKPILRDKSELMRHGIPYAGGEESKFKDEGRVRIKDTVTGLKDAEYTLDEIVYFLENQDHSALSISIACLDVSLNFKGKDIYVALIKAGFSKAEADFAIPAKLRNDSEMFYQNSINMPESKNQNVIQSAQALDKKELKQPLIKGQKRIKTTIMTLRRSSVSTAQVVNVLKELGVSAKDIVGALVSIEEDISKAGFRGLGSWTSFQDGRYSNVSSEINTEAVQVELVQSMNVAGYSKNEIVDAMSVLDLSAQQMNNILNK